MVLPKLHTNTYQFRGYCFASDLTKIFSVEMGGGGIAVDGGYKVRSEDVAIQNLDTSATLLFSFDTTTYSQLDIGGAFSLKLATDRVHLKCGPTDNSCYFQMTISLKNNWKF